MFFITLSLMAVSLGLGYQDVSLFVSSAFAVMGVALVAQWSILSNLIRRRADFFVSFFIVSASVFEWLIRMKILAGVIIRNRVIPCADPSR